MFVRNLPADAVDSDLVRVFQKYGDVDKALVMIHKSHGFVQFRNLDDAKACLNDVGVDGQTAEVEDEKAEPSEPASATLAKR